VSEGGIVPIVEPEVLLDGNHTIERCQEVNGAHSPKSLSRRFICIECISKE